MHHRLSVFFEHNLSLLQPQIQPSIFLWPLTLLGVQLMCPLCQMRCILFEKGKKLSGMNFFLINEVDLLLEWATPKLHLNDWIIEVWNPSWMQLPHQLRESTEYIAMHTRYMNICRMLWGVSELWPASVLVLLFPGINILSLMVLLFTIGCIFTSYVDV